ncbi:MAG: DUF2752 domain-containing protein [Deltaproteobacteria bacterium]|nr:DUF2752 domain-containing protein [Deltaproteobacteria bacterium]
MRLCARQLEPRELDHEKLWAGVSLLAAGLALAIPEGWRLGLGCPFKAVTGLPCLSCGSGRALQALLHFDPKTALGCNPLFVAALTLWGAFALYAGVVVVLRAPRLRFVGDWQPLRARVLAGVLLAAAANWVYLLARGI